ncbi:hypothetical protein Neosp_007666 [[Neocosmospora] mangrovei]
MSTAEHNTNRITLRENSMLRYLVTAMDADTLAMLTSSMTEGRRLRERGGQPVEYQLLDDDAEAALHAFKSLYGSDPHMLNLNPDEILQVAVFVDKWDLAE